MISQARDEVLQLITTAWTSIPELEDTLIVFEDVEERRPPTATEVWCRIGMKHVTGSQATLSNQDNRRRWKRTGIIYIQIFTPVGTGLSLADKYSKILLDALEGKSTPLVWIRNVRVNEAGRDGSWQQTNILADFEYDEEK